jgi:hypothetical protein
MSHLLHSRADLRRAFYRLTGTSEADSALSEHDTDPGSTVLGLLMLGLWEAQHYAIDVAAPDRWVGRHPVESWETEGRRRYTPLPDDFMRLVGDFETSALFYPAGDRWGRLIDPSLKTTHGDAYYIENERLNLTRLARPPRNVEIEYYYRHPDLTSDDPDAEGGAIDFPLEDRMLIVALAALEFSNWPSFPGDVGRQAAIQQTVKRWRERIHQRGRRSRQPRRVRHARALGNRFFKRGT